MISEEPDDSSELFCKKGHMAFFVNKCEQKCGTNCSCFCLIVCADGGRFLWSDTRTARAAGVDIWVTRRPVGEICASAVTNLPQRFNNILLFGVQHLSGLYPVPGHAKYLFCFVIRYLITRRYVCGNVGHVR